MAAKHACEVVIVAEAIVPTFALLPRATMYANGGRKFHPITAETRKSLRCVRTCYGRLRKHLRGFSTSMAPSSKAIARRCQEVFEKLVPEWCQCARGQMCDCQKQQLLREEFFYGFHLALYTNVVNVRTTDRQRYPAVLDSTGIRRFFCAEKWCLFSL